MEELQQDISNLADARQIQVGEVFNHLLSHIKGHGLDEQEDLILKKFFDRILQNEAREKRSLQLLERILEYKKLVIDKNNSLSIEERNAALYNIYYEFYGEFLALRNNILENDQLYANFLIEAHLPIEEDSAKSEEFEYEITKIENYQKEIITTITSEAMGINPEAIESIDLYVTEQITDLIQECTNLRIEINMSYLENSNILQYQIALDDLAYHYIIKTEEIHLNAVSSTFDILHLDNGYANISSSNQHLPAASAAAIDWDDPEVAFLNNPTNILSAAVNNTNYTITAAVPAQEGVSAILGLGAGTPPSGCYDA